MEAKTFSEDLSAFVDALSDEFLKQTGVGLYAFISPIKIHNAYQEFKEKQIPVHDFTHSYVRSYV